MYRASIVALMLLVSCALSVVSAAEVEFNYNGRVRVRGHDFDGPGLFKFALTSQNGQHVFWANDGVTLTGNEPTTSVAADVAEGFFSVNIGDTDLVGMAALNPAIFNTADRRVRLRVWFSDGTHGFQRLLPDALVLNPALLGLQSRDELNLFVDATNGNDEWPGISANRAKKTIQAAWNALPVLIDSTATIQLAPGIYPESVLLTGKTALGSYPIIISGNTADPASVTVMGVASEQTSATAVYPVVFQIENQRNLVLEGMRIARALSSGIDARSSSAYTLRDAEVTSHTVGIHNVTTNCVMERVNIHHNSTLLIARDLSQVTVRDCNAHHTGRSLPPYGHGLAIWSNSTMLMGGTVLSNCDFAVHTQYNSTVSFNGGSPNQINNNLYGIFARMNSVLVGSTAVYGYVTYSGNGTDRGIYTGTQTDQ